MGEGEKAKVRVRDRVRGRGYNRERQTTFMGNITVQSLPKVWTTAEFLLLLLLPSPYYSGLVPFYSTPVSKTESQSRPRSVGAHHSKATLFEKLLVQNGLFLLILCKLGGKRQEETNRKALCFRRCYLCTAFQGDSIRDIPVTPNWQSCKAASLACCSSRCHGERWPLNKASVIFRL